MARKKDVLETLSDDALLEQVFGNPADSTVYQQAVFLAHFRLAQRQTRFNMIISVGTAVYAVSAVIQLFLMAR